MTARVHAEEVFQCTIRDGSAATEIIMDSIRDDIPKEIYNVVIKAIKTVSKDGNEDKLYDAFFSSILNGGYKPVQAIATSLGSVAGYNDPLDAFEWGMFLVKQCKDCGLYELVRKEYDRDAVHVVPNFQLTKNVTRELDKLQFLPPMQEKPFHWTGNYDGGWGNGRSIFCGKRFVKHSKYVAYDVINTLQDIPWKVDTETYLTEKDTNHNLNKKKFLRVLNEYIDKEFYFVWRYDSRGRMYSSGYDLNIQSNEYGKALLSLANKEKITNVENLYIAIANHAGHDKLTWNERIQWTTNILNSDTLVEDIEWDEGILGRKALRALNDSIYGKASGYVMSLDATASGVQIMAMLSGCKDTAKWVNAIDPDQRYDLWTEICNRMNEQLDEPLERKIVKQCAMTHFYNSKMTPKALLKPNELSVFYDVLQGMLPGADSVMETINACWNEEADHHTWIMPDGHTVYVPVIETADAIYSDPELGDIPISYYEQTSSSNYRSLCPNLIHSIDSYVAREMIRRCDFQLAHIHDCFLFSPDHLQDVSKTYKEIMAEIADSNLLEDILRQITGDITLTLNKYSNDLSEDVLNSNYMLS